MQAVRRCQALPPPPYPLIFFPLTAADSLDSGDEVLVAHDGQRREQVERDERVQHHGAVLALLVGEQVAGEVIDGGVGAVLRPCGR